MTAGRRPPQERQACAWWIKCDPTAAAHGGWNWPDLFAEYRAGEPYLWSVGTALSQKNARLAKQGDPVFGYAAGPGFRVLLALAEVERGAVFVPGGRPPTPGSGLPGGFTVALRPVGLLETPITLAEVRRALSGHDPEFLRTRFGSIFKVGPRELRSLLLLVGRKDPAAMIPAAWKACARAPLRGTGHAGG